MNKGSKRKLTVMLASLLVLAFVLPGVGFADGPEAVYEVTITNLTRSGQPFTPPLLATSQRSLQLFKPGAPASFEIKEIAENGNLTPMVDALSGNASVSQVIVGDGPLMPESSVTFEVSADRGTRYLSYVAMLICTNDGFNGFNRIPLPTKVGQSRSLIGGAYDAGTEINTEDFADLVPPCPVLTDVPSDEDGTGMSDPALAEDSVVRRHRGIKGIADLIPKIHDWKGPVVKVVVTRVQ